MPRKVSVGPTLRSGEVPFQETRWDASYSSPNRASLTDFECALERPQASYHLRSQRFQMLSDRKRSKGTHDCPERHDTH